MKVNNSNRTFRLLEKGLDQKAKTIKILGLNILVWGATFFGYGFVTELLTSGSKGAGKLGALIFMGPAFAVVGSIKIGIKEQRVLTIDETGIKFGGPISSVNHFLWSDIKTIEFDASDSNANLHLRKSCKTIKIPLHKFDITTEQFKALTR